METYRFVVYSLLFLERRGSDRPQRLLAGRIGRVRLGFVGGVVQQLDILPELAAAAGAGGDILALVATHLAQRQLPRHPLGQDGLGGLGARDRSGSRNRCSNLQRGRRVCTRKCGMSRTKTSSKIKSQ